MRLQKKIKTLLMLSIFVTQFLFGVDFEKLITINPKGWNIPDISRLEKVSERDIQISDEIPTIVSAIYQKRKESNDVSPKTVNKRISLENKISNKETLEYYEVEFFNSLNIYTFKKSKRILCYQYARALSGKTAKEFMNQYIYGLDKGFFFDDGVGGDFVSTFIFDADDDSIFESSIFDPLNGNSKDLVKKIFDFKKKFRKNIERNEITQKLYSFRKKWVRYINYPSQQNAQNVLQSLYKLEYKRTCGLPKKQLGHWEWVWNTLNILEKDVFASEPIAVKIAFKLLPISIDTFSGEVLDILENFMRINPEMFLKELKANRNEVKFVIFGSKGLEELGYINLVVMEIKKKIDSLKSIKNTDLIDIKREFIDILEKELKLLKKNSE